MTLLITKDLQNPLANYITFRIKFEISNKIWEKKILQFSRNFFFVFIQKSFSHT